MKRDSTPVVAIFVLLVLGSLAFWAGTNRSTSDRRYIANWAEENKQGVIKLERCHWERGPYWNTEDYRIYKVKVEGPQGEKTFWFRFGSWFGVDVKEK